MASPYVNLQNNYEHMLTTRQQKVLVSGDPFFWLNPQNGAVIARNIANGLGNLRPERRPYFLANADAFTKALNEDINRWKHQLSGLVNLRVFSTQCGWHYAIMLKIKSCNLHCFCRVPLTRETPRF